MNSAVTSLSILLVAGLKLKKFYCISGSVFHIPKSVCLVKGKVLYSVNKFQLQPTSASQKLHTYTLADALVSALFGREKIVGSSSVKLLSNSSDYR